MHQLTAVLNATLATMGDMEATVERALRALDQAEEAIGEDPEL